MRRPLPILALCAVVLALPNSTALADPGDPTDLPAGGVLSRFQQLYERKANAEQAYTALTAELKAQRRATALADRELARARTELTEGRRRAAVLAREQYRGNGGFSPYLAILLARDPQDALDRGQALIRASEHQAAILRELFLAEQRLDRRAREARKALDKKQGVAERRKAQQRKVREQMAAVEELLASLGPDEIAAAEEALGDGGAPDSLDGGDSRDAEDSLDAGDSSDAGPSSDARGE